VYTLYFTEDGINFLHLVVSGHEEGMSNFREAFKKEDF
jgi:hypothetical protein